MMIGIIAVVWLVSAGLSAFLMERYFANAFPALGRDGKQNTMLALHFVLGPIALGASLWMLAVDDYGFDGKKSPWRHLN